MPEAPVTPDAPVTPEAPVTPMPDAPVLPAPPVCPPDPVPPAVPVEPEPAEPVALEPPLPVVPLSLFRAEPEPQLAAKATASSAVMTSEMDVGAEGSLGMRNRSPEPPATAQPGPDAPWRGLSQDPGSG